MVHMSLRIVTFSPAYTKTFSYRFHRNRKRFFAFHLASKRQRLKAITFENSFQREQYDNDTKTMYRCNTMVALSLKTISFSIKTYSCRLGLLFSLETVFKSYRFQSLVVKTQRKVCGFDENDMKTHSCKRGLNLI